MSSTDKLLFTLYAPSLLAVVFNCLLCFVTMSVLISLSVLMFTQFWFYYPSDLISNIRCDQTNQVHTFPKSSNDKKATRGYLVYNYYWSQNLIWRLIRENPPRPFGSRNPWRIVVFRVWLQIWLIRYPHCLPCWLPVHQGQAAPVGVKQGQGHKVMAVYSTRGYRGVSLGYYSIWQVH